MHDLSVYVVLITGFDMAALSRSLLDEIPAQLLDYFELRGIAPNPRRAPAATHIMPGTISHVSMGNQNGFSQQTPDAAGSAPLLVAPSTEQSQSQQLNSQLPPAAGPPPAYPVF